MQPDDIILNKACIIERCIRRVREEYAADPDLSNFTHLDALTLNAERACQACTDMAMHLVAQGHLGIPQSSADAFTLLEKAGILTPELKQAMQSMTGFRNVAVHVYQELDTDILRWVAEKGWMDWVRCCDAFGANIQHDLINTQEPMSTGN